jgi:hypothetical protein
MRRLAAVAVLALLVVACGRSPVLMINDFESKTDLDRLTWRCHYWLEQSTRLVTSGRAGLSVDLPPGEFPTLELREIPPNWRGCRWFEFDVLASDLAGGELLVRIDDNGPSENFADRFTGVVPLTGRPQHVRFPLERIRRADGGRTLDLRHMFRVLFFLKRADRRHTIYLDRVCLTR